MNCNIHIGAIGGLPGKLLLFSSAWFVPACPVTGFIIWWDRKIESGSVKNG